MSVKSLMFLTSALASAGLVIEPVAAAANGLSQLETWGAPRDAGKDVSNLRCDGMAGSNILQMNMPHVPVVTGNNNSAVHPSINAGINAAGINTAGTGGLGHVLNVYNHHDENAGPNVGPGHIIDAGSHGYFGKTLNVYGGTGQGSAPTATENGKSQGNRLFGLNHHHAVGEQPIAGTGNGPSPVNTAPQGNYSNLFGGNGGSGASSQHQVFSP